MSNRVRQDGGQPHMSRSTSNPSQDGGIADLKKKVAGPGGVAMKGRPRIQIPVHVFAFSVLFLPVGGYYIYYLKHKKSDEELAEILRNDEFYQQKIQKTERSREDFQKFFDQMKAGNAGGLDKQMSEMLQAGKGAGNLYQESNGAKKRLYAVDESLLGTEEGARLAAENLERAKKEQERVKQRDKERRLKLKEQRKKKKNENKPLEEKGIESDNSSNDSAENTNDITDTPLVKTAAAVVAGGTIFAVVAAVIFGSGRSTR